MHAALPRTSPFFWNFISRRYARSPIADVASYNRKLEMTQALMRPDMHVLEFGCGTGGTALKHAPHVACYDAIDFSKGMIDIAREKAWNAAQPNLRFALRGIEDVTPDEGPYDMLLGLSVLHLVRDRAGVIAHAFRLLKPGGYLVTSTACIGDMGLLPRLFVPVGRTLRVFPHVDVFTGDDLRAELRGAGFEITQDWRPSKDKALFLVARKPG